MSVGVSFFFDLLLIALLGVTIYFCQKLNKHIQAIRDSKSEMAEIIEQFANATERAKESIEEIKNSSKKLIETLDVKVNKANFIVDDLSFMIEKANKIADSLENNLPHTKKPEPYRKNEAATTATLKGAEVLAKSAIAPSAEKAAPTPKTSENKTQTAAEKELLEALNGIR